MVFGHDVLDIEVFEIIKKNWEKFVKVGEKFVKVGGRLRKVRCRLRKIWQNLAVFGFFGEKGVEVWSWGVVNSLGINFH